MDEKLPQRPAPRPRRNLLDELADRVSGGADSGARGWLGQVLALLATLIAALQFVFMVFDLASRPLAPLLGGLRYVIAALFLAGAAVSLRTLARPGPRTQRLWAGGALGLIVLAGAGWGGWTYYSLTRPPKAIVVLVADFDGSQATEHFDWGQRIRRAVKEDLAPLELKDAVEVRPVYEVITEAEQAQARGQAEKATLVIWGWYDDAGVYPHFELLRSAQVSNRRLVAPPKDLMGRDFYLRFVPSEMSYIVKVVLGLLYYAQGEYGAAEMLLTTAIDGAPEPAEMVNLEIPHFYRALARTYTRQPAAGTVADLEAAVTLKPDFWEAHWNLAIAYTDHCTPTLALDAALAQALAVRDLQPDNADTYWLLGQVYKERGDMEPAIAAFEQALRLKPDHADAQDGLALVLYGLGRTAEADAAYQRALTLRQQAQDGEDTSADATAAQVALGYAYTNAGQYDEAIAIFQSLLRFQPDNADLHRHLGNAYYWQGKTTPGQASTQLAEAIREYEAARELEPDDAFLLTILGGAYAEAGRQDDALRAYQEAAAADPCDDGALLLLASQYDTVGRAAESVAAFRKLTELNPRLSLGWHVLASEAYERGDYAEAAAYFRTALEAGPSDDGPYFGLGLSLYGLGDFVGAEGAFRQALELAPGDAITWTSLGDTLDQLGRIVEAIEAYKTAAGIEPDNVLTWLYLGLLYEKVEQWPDALAAYDEAVARQPDYGMAYYARGRIHQRLGEYAQAVAEYELAVRYGPNDAFYWETLAGAYILANRPDDALAALNETLQRDPQRAFAYLLRGSIYEDRGDDAQAAADYRQAVAWAGDNTDVLQAAETGLQRQAEQAEE